MIASVRHLVAFLFTLRTHHWVRVYVPQLPSDVRRQEPREKKRKTIQFTPRGGSNSYPLLICKAGERTVWAPHAAPTVWRVHPYAAHTVVGYHSGNMTTELTSPLIRVLAWRVCEGFHLSHRPRASKLISYSSLSYSSLLPNPSVLATIITSYYPYLSSWN